MQHLDILPNNPNNQVAVRLAAWCAALCCCGLLIFSELGGGINTALGATIDDAKTVTVLPPAIADDQTKTTSTAPTKFRVLANEQIVLLTLRVHNIQVQERWDILSDQKDALTIVGGTLSSRGIIPPTRIIATIVVEDMFQKLNPNYANLSLQITITLEFLSNFQLPPIPPLRALFGQAITLHTLTLGYTYSLLNHAALFAIDDNRFFTSLGNAIVGLYTITIQAQNDASTEEVIASVQIYPTLSLANAPPLEFETTFVTAATVPLILHIFTVTGGIGDKTYTLIAEHSNYFSLGGNGVLSLTNNQIPPDVYTMTIRAIDEDNNSIDALATVRIISPLVLGDVALDIFAQDFANLQHTLIAEGGFGNKTYTIIAGNDDRYFALSANGVLSLTTTITAGFYTLSIQVTDDRDYAATARAVIEITDLFIADAPPGLSAVEGKMKVLHTFIAIGATTGLSFTIIAGNAAGYFSVTDSGILSVGVDATVGLYTLVVQVRNDQNKTNQARAVIEITPPLPDSPFWRALFGQPITLDTLPLRYTYSLLNHETLFAIEHNRFTSLGNAIVGLYTITIQAQNGTNIEKVTARVQIYPALSLDDAPPLTLDATLVMATAPLSLHTFTVTGGIGDKTYTLIAAPEQYFSLGSDGVLSLTDNLIPPDVYTLTIRAIDEDNNSIDALATVRIVPPLVLGDVDIPAEDFVYLQHTFIAEGGFGDKTYTIIAGNDEHYFALSDDGVLSLTVTTIAGFYTLSIQVTDDRNYAATARAIIEVTPSLFITPPATNVSITDVSLSVVAGKITVLHTFIPSGAAINLSYMIIAGNTPGYFSITDSGVLSAQGGATVGFYTLTVEVRNNQNKNSHARAVIEVIPSLSFTQAPIIIYSWASITARVHTFQARGGIGAIAYTLAADTDYFKIDAQGHLSLVAAMVGVHTLTIQATTAYDDRATVKATIHLAAPIVFADIPPLYAMVGPAQNLHTLTASGGFGKTYDIPDNPAPFLSLKNGILAINANNYKGSFIISIRAYDTKARDQQGKKLFTSALATVHIFSPLSLTAPPYTNFTEGLATNLYTVTAYDGFGDYTYHLAAGDSANHFTLGLSSGVLEIQPTAAAGRYTLSLVVSDVANNAYGILVTVEVVDNLVLAEVPWLDAVVGNTVNLYTLSVSGGGMAKSLTIVAGDGTTYFTLLSDSGILSMNSNATARVYTLSVEVRDEHNYQYGILVTVHLVDPLLLVAVSSLTITESEEATEVHTLSATGGGGMNTYTIVAGTNHFTLGSKNGVLTMQANTPVMVYTLSVAVRDQYNNRDEIEVVVEVSVNNKMEVSLATASPLIAFADAEDPAPLYTLSLSGKGSNKTYTIVAGDPNEYFTLGSNGILAFQNNIVAGFYNLSIVGRDEYGNQDGALVKVNVGLLNIQGSQVATWQGQTFFRFSQSGVSDYDLDNNYYIYYRGRYFQISDNNAYFNSNPDVQMYEVYITHLINKGNDFSMVHKSLIDGTNEAKKKAVIVQVTVQHSATFGLLIRVAHSGDKEGVIPRQNAGPDIIFESLNGNFRETMEYNSRSTSDDTINIYNNSQLMDFGSYTSAGYGNNSTHTLIASQAAG